MKNPEITAKQWIKAVIFQLNCKAYRPGFEQEIFNVRNEFSTTSKFHLERSLLYTNITFISFFHYIQRWDSHEKFTMPENSTRKFYKECGTGPAGVEPATYLHSEAIRVVVSITQTLWFHAVPIAISWNFLTHSSLLIMASSLHQMELPTRKVPGLKVLQSVGKIHFVWFINSLV